MAGAMRKMAVYLGLVENEDQYDEYDSYDRHHDQRDYDERTRQLHAVRDDEPALELGAATSAPVADARRCHASGLSLTDHHAAPADVQRRTGDR